MEERNSREAVEKTRVPGQGRRISLIIIILLFVIGTVQALSGRTGTVTTEVNDEYLGVAGTYGEASFVKLTEVTDIQFVESFAFGTCVEGEETGNTVSGIYSNDLFEQYTTHAYTGKEAYIIVQDAEKTLVFNCSTESRTEKFYDELTQAIELAQ